MESSAPQLHQVGAANDPSNDPTWATAAEYVAAQRLAYAPLFFQAARVARDLGVLEALARQGDRATDLDELIATTGLSRYATRLLLDACTSLDLCAGDADGGLRLTRLGMIFLRDERVRVSTDFVHHVCHRGAFHLEAALQRGEPAGLPTLGPWNTIYEGVPDLPAETRTSWYAYDHLYSDGVFPRAVRHLRSKGVQRVLDIGGNTGRFATLAAATMDVTIVDHSVELKVARRNVDAAGVGARVSTFPMELRDHHAELPVGFDAVWISQVLDCFPEPDVVSILTRAQRSLVPGGRVYVVESFTDRQPTEAATVALHGLSLYFAAIANGTSRMYASTDIIDCVARAGMRVAEDRTLGPWHTLLVLEP